MSTIYVNVTLKNIKILYLVLSSAIPTKNVKLNYFIMQYFLWLCAFHSVCDFIYFHYTETGSKAMVPMLFSVVYTTRRFRFGLALLFVYVCRLSFLHFNHLAWGRGSWSLCLSWICLLAMHTLICVTFSLPPGAQTDLSLRWVHSHFVGFIMRRLKSG